LIDDGRTGLPKGTATGTFLGLKPY